MIEGLEGSFTVLNCLLFGLVSSKQGDFRATGKTFSALDGTAVPSVIVSFTNDYFTYSLTSNPPTSPYPGYFEINLTYGVWNVTASIDDFWPYSNQFAFTRRDSSCDIYLVPLPPENGWQIVAFWTPEADLDIHFYGPFLHVYYLDSEWVNATSLINLTRDSTNGNHPETITFDNLQCGHYELWMRKFPSGAIMSYFPWVDIYNTSYLQTIWGMDGEGDKTTSEWWHVFDFETDFSGIFELTVVNYFYDRFDATPMRNQSDLYEMFNCKACCGPTLSVSEGRSETSQGSSFNPWLLFLFTPFILCLGGGIYYIVMTQRYSRYLKKHPINLQFNNIPSKNTDITRNTEEVEQDHNIPKHHSISENSDSSILGDDACE